MKFQLYSFLILFCLLMFTISPLWAQERHTTAEQKLEEAYQQGTLTLDQKILFQFYALSNQQQLPSQYQPDDTLPVKCGTPAVIAFHQNQDKLSPSTVREIESMMEPQISASETYISASGRFAIHYETSGEHAVPNQEYVEKVAAAADSSYRHQVQNLGYSNPVTEGDTYDIFIENVEPIYGDTRHSGNGTYIRIENDFSENFPPNDHPDGNQTGAIYATIAHELKHAIQYANSEWYGFPGDPSSPHSINWSEMDATLMEEVVYDEVNDYYNYLESSSSIFNTPGNGVPGAYWQVSWFIYFKEKFGSQFWVDVWSSIKERYEEEKSAGSKNYLGMFETIEKTLSENYNTSIDREFSESHLWHMASGEFSPFDYGFEERDNYPTPNISATIMGQDSLQNSRLIGLRAANYFHLESQGIEQDQIQISFRADTSNYAAGAIAYLNDGSTDTFFGASRNNQELNLKTPWDWNEIETVGITTVNLSRSSKISVNLEASSYEAEFVTLTQNYPNPFNPSTTISFKLLEQADIQLKVYDVTGRLVKTLIDQTLPAGSHEQEFNAGNLASGIYIYQLISDRKSVAKKMTLVK